jgi:hypothetical protein
MIKAVVMPDEGIVLVEPSGRLEEADFERLAEEIDGFPGDPGRLTGLIIHTKTFPGWNGCGAFLGHMKFVKEHHRSIRRVAIVADSRAGAIAPAVANLFVSAKTEHFDYDGLDQATDWIREAD